MVASAGDCCPIVCSHRGAMDAAQPACVSQSGFHPQQSGIRVLAGKLADDDRLRRILKHPMVNNEERDAYVRMGEIAYIESRGGRAREWVKNNPGDFLKLTAKRVIYFW